jgi:hypothetical protein
MTSLNCGGASEVVGVTPEWDMAWVFRNVSLLPDAVLVELARGPRYGWDCTVCHILQSHPDNDSPWGRLTRWHQEPQDMTRFGIDGPRQDPARCGVIYGIARAILEARG